eukprot:1160429-Pelagomonas_calceolata.AAC.24
MACRALEWDVSTVVLWSLSILVEVLIGLACFLGIPCGGAAVSVLSLCLRSPIYGTLAKSVRMGGGGGCKLDAHPFSGGVAHDAVQVGRQGGLQIKFNVNQFARGLQTRLLGINADQIARWRRNPEINEVNESKAVLWLRLLVSSLFCAGGMD